MAPLTACARAQSAPVEAMAYTVDASPFGNLKALGGTKLYVALRSGKTLAGTVGREYFDALIRIDDICAIDARFRMPGRQVLSRGPRFAVFEQPKIRPCIIFLRVLLFVPGRGCRAGVRGSRMRPVNRTPYTGRNP